MTPRVLVLDNDPSLRRLMEMAFRRAGLRIDATGCAGEAEAWLRARRIDFLVLDLNLGAGRSGDRLARSWHAAGCLPPFLILTGMPRDPRLAALEELPGFHGVVAKPFSITELVRAVRDGAGVASSSGDS